MIGISMSDELERQAFAKRAAAKFAANPKEVTYADGAVMDGAWFAVRWGLGDDCVLVFRIGSEPVNYITSWSWLTTRVATVRIGTVETNQRSKR